MPTKKRRRPVTADDDPQRSSKAHSKPRAPLASFASLPRELRQMIVEMACASPRSSAASPGRSPFALEVDTSVVFSLALVCKELKEQVTPLLWNTITITRPSALYALQQALLANPRRAELITSLHIGPQDVLPSYWWPLSSVCLEGDSKYASTAGQNEFSSYWWIASSLEQDALPFECSTRQPWRCDSRAAGCRGAAVFEALQVIQETLGLKLVQRGRREQRSSGLVFAAQAALDLYLERIRLLEKQKPELIELAKKPRAPLQCRNGSCDHYPSLHLRDVPSSAGINPSDDRSRQPTPPHNAVVLRYAEILEHMARPGAPTDRFDHPLIFERTGVQVIVNNPARRGPQTYYPSQASYSIDSTSWSVSLHDTFKWPAPIASRSSTGRSLPTSTGTSRLENAPSAAAATSTVVRVVEVALDVLKHTTKLENLSLTGYLPAAVSSWQERTAPNLRRCSLGPTVPGWDPRVDFSHLKRIEELRICGIELSESEARTITQLSELKKLDRVMGAWEHIEPSIPQVLDVLHKDGVPSSPADGDPGAPLATTALQIVARLDIDMIETVLALAAKPETRRAWIHGHPLSDTPRRLHIFVSGVAVRPDHPNQVSNPLADSTNEVWEEMYGENRAYWRGETGDAPASSYRWDGL